MTHSELTAIALKWLKRPHSGKGPGCQLAMAEVGGLFGGERCDAYGVRWGWEGGSIVVEAKASRSDFLADRKKPHRNGEVLGLGDYRYYICPEGMITIDDLPDRWGLLWVNKRGHVKLVAGHICVYLAANYRDWRAMATYWKHEADTTTEVGMLAHLLERFGDPETLNVRHKQLYAANIKLRTRLDEEIKAQRRETSNLRHESFMAGLKLERYRQLYGELPEEDRPPIRRSR